MAVICPFQNNIYCRQRTIQSISRENSRVWQNASLLTPVIIVNHSPTVPFYLTEVCTSSNKFLMIVTMSFGKPYFFTLHQNEGRWTLSKAFLKSIKFTITGLCCAVTFRKTNTSVAGRLKLACFCRSWLSTVPFILPRENCREKNFAWYRQQCNALPIIAISQVAFLRDWEWNNDPISLVRRYRFALPYIIAQICQLWYYCCWVFQDLWLYLINSCSFSIPQSLDGFLYFSYFRWVHVLGISSWLEKTL